MRILQIIIALSVLCCSESSPLNSTTTSIPPKEPTSGLELFVDKFNALLRLTNGIVLQQTLLEKPDNVNEVTGELLHVHRQWFLSVMNLTLDGVLEDLKELQTESVKYPTTSKFEEMSAAMNPVNNLIADFADLSVGVKRESVMEYVDVIDNMKSREFKYAFMEHSYNLLSVSSCILNGPLTEPEDIAKCERTMGMYITDYSVIWGENGMLMNHKYWFKSTLKYLEKVDAFHKALKAVERMSHLMHHLGTLQSIGKWAEAAKRESDEYSKVMSKIRRPSGDTEAFKKLLRTDAKSVNSYSGKFVEGFSRGAKDVELLFREMRKGGTLERLLAVEEVKNLTQILVPLEKYGKEAVKMNELFSNWQKITEDDMKNAARVHKAMGRVYEWKDSNVWKIEKLSVELLQVCFTRVPSTIGPFNMTYIREISDYVVWMKTSLQIYMEAVKKLEPVARKVKYQLYLRKTIEDELGTEGGVHKIIDMMRSNKTVLNYLKEIVSQTAFYEEINNSSRSKIIKDHPDITEFQRIHRHVRVSGIFKSIHCLANNQKEMRNTEKVMNGAGAVQVLAKNYTQLTRILLKSISDVQKMVHGARNYWKSLSRHQTSQNVSLQKYWIVEELPANSLRPLLNASLSLGLIRDAFKNIETLNRTLEFEFQVPGEFWDVWDSTGRDMTEKLVNNLNWINAQCKAAGVLDMNKMKSLMELVGTIPGIRMDWSSLEDYERLLEGSKQAEVFKDLQEMSEMRLDFATSTEYWKLVDMSLENVKRFLVTVSKTVFMGKVAKPIALPMKHSTSFLFKQVIGEFPLLYLALSVVGALLVIGFFGFIVYSLTPSGRTRWKRYFVSRYASQKVLDLYWRYSFFIDQESEKNSLFEAVREINYDQVKALVKRGVYVNVYNNFGNTPLHNAVMNGNVGIVKVLIKNGADRNAHNAGNQTPEMLLTDCLNTTTRTGTESTRTCSETTTRQRAGGEQIGPYGEMQMMFDEYRNKTFRPRVPELLPIMAYHIRVDFGVNGADKFIEMFKGNVTDQKSGVTHFIVPTGKDGVFESDDFGYIMCVFLPTMLMKSQWMGACLEKKSNLRNDYKFRVEKVKYKGVIYDTVLKWANWVHKQMLPFLYGVQFYVAIQGFGEGESRLLRSLVEMHGAVWCEEMPVKEQYNTGSHPFHHFNLGPLFVIHDGMIKLDHLRNDPDKMYTLLTFDQFIAFMLKLNVTYDPQRKLPIPVSNRVHQEDSIY